VTQVTDFDEPLISETETAERFHVKPQTLAAWRNRKRGPAYVKVGRRVFYRPSFIKEWLDAQVVRPSARWSAR
jgi:hypothetical protein